MKLFVVVVVEVVVADEEGKVVVVDDEGGGKSRNEMNWRLEVEVWVKRSSWRRNVVVEWMRRRCGGG